MTYLGIDLYTRNMTICAVSSNGKKIGEWKFTNHTEQLDNLLQEISRPLKAIVEATSSWYWLADWAENRDIELILAHAKMLKAIAYAKVKTDSVDAHTMAQLLAADLIPAANMVMGTQRDLRELLRARLRFVWRRCKVQDSRYNLFFKYNVPIPKYPFRDLTTTFRSLLPWKHTCRSNNFACWRARSIKSKNKLMGTARSFRITIAFLKCRASEK